MLLPWPPNDVLSDDIGLVENMKSFAQRRASPHRNEATDKADTTTEEAE